MALLFTTGCPVPEPPPPKTGERIVGADFTASAIGHWACPETDVVVAKDKGRLLIHELTLDYVLSESQALPNNHVGFVLPIGESEFVYDVPPAPTEPLLLTIKGSGRPPTPTKCPPAPIPQILK